jgi:hypothetical protein
MRGHNPDLKRLTEVRLSGTSWKVRCSVKAAILSRVIRHGDCIHQIRMKIGKWGGSLEELRGRVVLEGAYGESK